MNKKILEVETILIVDDTPDNLKVLIVLLETSGFQIRVAANGRDAVQIADIVNPSVILLDILMPGMDGFETCAKIKENPDTADIPILFLSALADAHNIARGFEAGGVDYITKPFRREEVLARLRTHATTRRQRTELIDMNRRLNREVEQRKQTAAALAESELQLNEAQSLACMGSWHRDVAADAVVWSENLHRLLGYSPGEVSASFKQFKKHIHPDDLDSVSKVFHSCVYETNPYDIEFRFIPVDGEVRYARAIGEVECDNEARPVRIHGTFQDITEQKRRGKELKMIHERLDNILKYSPNVITALDETGRYLNMNPAGQRVLDMPEENIVGTSCRDILPPEVSNTFLERIRTVIENEAVLEVEDQFLYDSREHVFSTTLFPIFGNSGRPSAVGGIAMDITERKRAERERLRMERRLHALRRLESLGVMAGGIAHDFNNLLMVVQGNIEIAKEGLPNEGPEKRALEASETAVRKAADLVRQLLAYTGKGHFIMKPVDIGSLLQEVSDSLRSAVSERIELRFDFPADLPGVEGEKTQLRQLLENLAANAAESYDASTGGVVTIAAGIRTCDEQYLSETVSDAWMGYDTPFSGSRFIFFEVKDRGCGMEEETRKRIFEPFFTKKFQGRGLGLAAVLGIIRGHKGYIRVESEPGRGTTVRVLLPVACDDIAVPSEKETPSTAVAAPPSDPAKGAGLILLVDDDDQIRRLVQRMLERLGYDTLRASGGVEAIETFKRNRKTIDLVICDLTMPGMSGVEVLDKLRFLDDAVPVILSSGYSQDDLRNRYRNKGFSGFLQKPFPMRTLARLLEEILGEANPSARPIGT